MVYDFTSRKIPVYTNINDNPVAPTQVKAGNGSHVVSIINSIIDEFQNSLNQIVDDLNQVIQQIEDVASTSGGKADTIVIATGTYEAKNNDSLVINTNTTIYLPENPKVGSYIELFLISNTFEVFFEVPVGKNFNDSYNWSLIKLIKEKATVILFWLGENNGGWFVSDLTAFALTEQTS